MKTNFHTHTFRCGHATGDEEDMIKSAIDTNIEILGMSCHVPLPHYRRHLIRGIKYAFSNKKVFKTWLTAMKLGGPNMRMAYKYKTTYEDNIRQAQKKYKDKIKIYIGFEAEYFKEYLPYYQEMLTSGEIDYLILGQHFDSYSIASKYYGRSNINHAAIEKYKDDVIAAFETKLFSYLAHPDLFMIGKVHWDSFCERITREICNKAKETNTPLEVNGGGMRRGKRKVDGEWVYQYPNTHFWDIVGEIGNDVVLGLDAHAPEEINDEMLQDLHAFAKEHNLHVIDTFPFKKGNLSI